jgi:hypothetical protein
MNGYMKEMAMCVLLLSSLLCLSACVSFTNRAEFSIGSIAENTTISISVARFGFYTNIHGGKFYGHYIKVPRGVDIIESDQIKLSSGGGKWPISRKSRIVITGDGPCELTLELYAQDGSPVLFSGLNINGTYKLAANRCER